MKLDKGDNSVEEQMSQYHLIQHSLAFLGVILVIVLEREDELELKLKS